MTVLGGEEPDDERFLLGGGGGVAPVIAIGVVAVVIFGGAGGGGFSATDLAAFLIFANTFGLGDRDSETAERTRLREYTKYYRGS